MRGGCLEVIKLRICGEESTGEGIKKETYAMRAEAYLAEDIAWLHSDIAEEFPAIYDDGSMDSADAESEMQPES